MISPEIRAQIRRYFYAEQEDRHDCPRTERSSRRRPQRQRRAGPNGSFHRRRRPVSFTPAEMSIGGLNTDQRSFPMRITPLRVAERLLQLGAQAKGIDAADPHKVGLSAPPIYCKKMLLPSVKYVRPSEP